MLERLEVALADGAPTEIPAGHVLSLVARAVYSGERVEDVTAEAVWTSSDPNIATVDDVGAKGRVQARARGSVTVKAVYTTREATFQVTVGEPLVTGLALDYESFEVERRQVAELRATATFSDGTSREVTDLVAWGVSEASTATITAPGVVAGLRVGTTTVTAELGGHVATARADVTCTYPSGPAWVELYQTFPRVRWAAAYRPDGTTAELDMLDVYCETGPFADAPVQTIGVVVGAGWCPNCPAYTRATQAMAEAAEANGMLLIYAVIEDGSYRASDSAYAHRDIEEISPNGRGWRVGDTDAAPRMFFQRSPYITAFPSAFVVRTRDMMMIADRDRFPGAIPLDQIAARPEADWTNGYPFENACAEGDEEAGEPNDEFRSATPLGLGTVHGGICSAGLDFYEVTHEGRWRLTLDFSHQTGDLDVYVWNTAANEPRTSNNTPIGSAGTTDREQFTYQGASIVAVVGYSNASGAYDLTLEAL
ncbi:Ig-like domain-containing protein [Myxococcota bacterium]|nr:Ig-like domain-containing protein [Myxococcota bacterium]